MSIDQLAALDAAERHERQAHVIAEVRREIDDRRAKHGRTDCLERHLAQLEATS